MPRIQVKLIDEVFAPAQKKAAIAELTRAIVSVQGKQPITLVVIEEESSEESELSYQPVHNRLAREICSCLG
jgi:phenylpyruvate tautomerase PptA (4-oxalocrotonate tautomerase family)